MICFVIWFTDEKRLALFPGGIHHHESLTLREQDLNLQLEFRLS